MASTSRRTLSASSPARPRPLTDVFKPKFPIDPFAASTMREPWFLRPDALPSLPFQSRRDVILVLGAPSVSELDPLLSSKLLSNSLLIVATHQPLSIPHTCLPTVRILRLTEPLAIEREGAVRFAVILEWAKRVARLWRKHGGYGAIELTDDNDGSEHLPPTSIFRFRGSHSTPPSPRASATHLPAEDPRASSVSHLQMPDVRPRPQSLSSKIWSRPRVPSLPYDESQRTFDGLVNFLPKDISDKAILKQAILVTTISANFLVSSMPRYAERSPRRPRPSFGAMSSNSSTSISLPPTPPFQSGESLSTLNHPIIKPHILHVLPGDPHSFSSFSRSKLVQSIESFLISYAYPSSLDMKSSPTSRVDRAYPYIMTASTLGEKIAPASPSSSSSDSPYNSWPPDCSLLDLVLCGSLDGEDPQAHGPQARALPRSTPRALLTRMSDIVLLAEDAPTPPTVIVSQSDQHPGRSGGASRRSRDSSPSSSSASSSSPKTPSSPSARSMSPLSPLAKGEQCVGLNGLPTPPDSEESGMESEEVRMAPRQRADAVPAGAPKEDVSSSTKARRMRWRFWKRSTRGSQ